MKLSEQLHDVQMELKLVEAEARRSKIQSQDADTLFLRAKAEAEKLRSATLQTFFPEKIEGN